LNAEAASAIVPEVASTYRVEARVPDEGDP
jgi:hypothetical protein